MKQKKENRVALLLHWAGEQKIWLFLAIFLSAVSGLCIIVPYIGIYRLMDATFNHTCTQELVVHTVVMIAVAVTLRFALFGCSGVAAHKGAYGALFKVRCMVAEHMARAPLGALNERRTGDIKTVLNEDIEKLELFLAHNLPVLSGGAGSHLYLSDDRQYSSGIDFPGSADPCCCCNGDDVPQYG